MKLLKKIVRRCFAAALIVGAAAGIAVGCVNLYVYSQTKEAVVSAEEAAEFAPDCILVLGAGVREDGTPSHMLEDRLLTGVTLYNEEVSAKLLMSGDHGRVEYDEVNTMKDFAKEKGVPSEDIFMDHAGFSTYDSLYRAKEIFGAERVVIVSQKYHLYRALYIAEALGIKAIGVPADLRTYRGQIMREIRELLARAKDFCYTVLKPGPVVLGEPVSLDGSGDVTNDK
ncbi:MAG: SanA protein [Ruminococcaceae bacterium]|nr:SanA protein [Oscillospiraceae bacterium]